MVRTWVAIVVVGLLSGPAFGATAAGGPGGPATQPGAEAPVKVTGRVPANLDFRQVVREAKDKVFPAVVFIKCIRESHESGKKASEEVAGSGVIVAPAGEVVTNWHVVDKAVEIRCLLLDGRAVTATVVGTDKDTDLALIRLKLPAGSKPLASATLGKAEKLTEGDFVMACGAPWGLSRSVSMGIIACTRRYLQDHSEYSLWLQTDALICPGNSGGPLVNTAGEVVGINALGTNSNDMGFAIPSETVERVIASIRQNGLMKWSWTGLELQALRDFNRNIYFDETEGVIVASAEPDSPARRAGFQTKDRIVKVNGTSLTAATEEDLPAIRRAIGQLPLNQLARVDVVRNGQPLTLELTPREKGKVEGEELDCPRWDLTVKTINQFDNPDLYYYREKGVFIYGVKHPGNASAAGLEHNDIIVKIEGQEVRTLKEVEDARAAAIKNLKANPRVLLTVLRNGLQRQVVLDFQRDYEKD